LKRPETTIAEFRRKGVGKMNYIDNVVNEGIIEGGKKNLNECLEFWKKHASEQLQESIDMLDKFRGEEEYPADEIVDDVLDWWGKAFDIWVSALAKPFGSDRVPFVNTLPHLAFYRYPESPDLLAERVASKANDVGTDMVDEAGTHFDFLKADGAGDHVKIELMNETMGELATGTYRGIVFDKSKNPHEIIALVDVYIRDSPPGPYADEELPKLLADEATAGAAEPADDSGPKEAT
jgi:hypothetical protein